MRVVDAMFCALFVHQYVRALYVGVLRAYLHLPALNSISRKEAFGVSRAVQAPHVYSRSLRIALQRRKRATHWFGLVVLRIYFEVVAHSRFRSRPPIVPVT